MRNETGRAAAGWLRFGGSALESSLKEREEASAAASRDKQKSNKKEKKNKKKAKKAGVGPA